MGRRRRAKRGHEAISRRTMGLAHSVQVNNEGTRNGDRRRIEKERTWHTPSRTNSGRYRGQKRGASGSLRPRLRRSDGATKRGARAYEGSLGHLAHSVQGTRAARMTKRIDERLAHSIQDRIWVTRDRNEGENEEDRGRLAHSVQGVVALRVESWQRGSRSTRPARPISTCVADRKTR